MEVLIIGLCPEKFWCLREVVAYWKWSLTRGTCNHTWSLDCIIREL